jgi:hypothetical protein
MIATILKLVRLSWFGIRQPAQFFNILKVRKAKLSFLSRLALVDLSLAVSYTEANEIPGCLIEAGSALGGSAIVMAKAKRPKRPLFLYDTFDQIPAPSDKDGEDGQSRYQQIVSGEAAGIRGGTYYGYLTDLESQVRRNLTGFGFPLEPHHIQLVKGLFQETLFPDGPVAMAHIDCDWYESVKICLERIVPDLSMGGVLAIDDYEHWSGCRRAVDEYFDGKRDQYRFVFRSRLYIYRLR